MKEQKDRHAWVGFLEHFSLAYLIYPSERKTRLHESWKKEEEKEKKGEDERSS